jgi:adenylosuccinate synthase
LPTHRLLDAASEASKGAAKIGSTLKGIGPTYMDKTGRNGLRIGDILENHFDLKYNDLKEKHLRMLQQFNFPFDLSAIEEEWLKSIEWIKKLTIIDSEHYLDNAIKNGKKILAEGAQGSLLDIDFGSYPFVTSSNTVAAGACTGLGIAPNRIGDVFGIFKAYCTRVGSGPFPTELDDAMGEAMRKEGNEFGSTTGRARRCGWLDIPALKYACMINGVTQLYMMKADVLSIFEEIKICTSYRWKGEIINYFPYDCSPEQLEPLYTTLPGWNQPLTHLQNEQDFPTALQQYISFIEEQMEIPITLVSVGPDRKQTILRQQ